MRSRWRDASSFPGSEIQGSEFGVQELSICFNLIDTDFTPERQRPKL
jgi:hypothetical protein